MSIRSRIRTIPNFPEEGIMFRDISTLIADPLGLQLVVKELQDRYEKRDDIDLIVGIEARGFIVGAALAYALKKGFIMIRKPGKLPGRTISKEYQLEYGTDRMEIQADAFTPQSKILLFDDLIATGGTIMAAIALIEKLGGIITETACIIDLTDVGGSTKLTDRGYEIFSVTEFEGD